MSLLRVRKLTFQLCCDLTFVFLFLLILRFFIQAYSALEV